MSSFVMLDISVVVMRQDDTVLLRSHIIHIKMNEPTHDKMNESLGKLI